MVENLIPHIVSGLITLSAAIGGVKVGMNGIHKRLDRFISRLDRQDEKLDNITERVVRTETKLEIFD